MAFSANPVCEAADVRCHAPPQAALGPLLPAMGSVSAWSQLGLAHWQRYLLSTVLDSFVYSTIHGAPTTPRCMICAFQ